MQSAVAQSVELLARARSKNVPVYYTRVSAMRSVSSLQAPHSNAVEVLYNKNGHDGGVFVKKVPLLREWVEGNPMTFIVDELTPEEDDTIIIKQYPYLNTISLTLGCYELIAG